MATDGQSVAGTAAPQRQGRGLLCPLALLPLTLHSRDVRTRFFHEVDFPAQARAPRTSGSQVRGNLRLLTRPDTCVQPPPAALVLNWAPLISQARLHVSPSSPQPCDRGCSRKPVGQRRPAGRLRSAHTAFSKSEDVTVKTELASPPEETADPEDMLTPVPARQLPV